MNTDSRRPAAVAGLHPPRRLETFSYLPELSGDEIEAQLRSILDRGLVVGIEHTEKPDSYDHYWTLWKLPLFGEADPAVVLEELEACRRENPSAYVRVNGYDPIRQGQVVSFVAVRPERVM
jgi:ribulose-bisphosphate carboxylase small chain